MSERLSEIDVAVLAGGLGTRLAGVLGDTPKILAPVGGEPYIAFLLDWLARSGVRRVVFCLGHLAEKVEAWLAANRRDGMAIETVREPSPAGTAGALRYAAPLLRSDPVMVMNGDSFIDANLDAFLDDFIAKKRRISIVCARVRDCSRYGRIELNPNGTIARFLEKDPKRPGPGYINAGIYLFSRKELKNIVKSKKSSLERDIFPGSAYGGVKGGFTVGGTFHDIGTPESLAAAAAILAPHRHAATTEDAP